MENVIHGDDSDSMQWLKDELIKNYWYTGQIQTFGTCGVKILKKQ